MERLFHIIEVVVSQKLWKPISLSKQGLSLSHLTFVDDLILFSKASLDQVEVIQSCLELFCKSLGQKVSLEKTRIFFSKNVGWSVREGISSTLGFQRMDNLGKYLGVPIQHDRVNKRLYSSIINKVNQRLSSWKAKTLFIARRLTFTKSVLATFPVYTM
uniref:Ribonuclease H protein At1g65750 family n=1 Tax=Cajanus cajan TaxID=3821 RepID=A0A151S4W2_CAJCA|nr:Putative ribonuclease H protein At1g65750 family [Cajanus cajan]